MMLRMWLFFHTTGAEDKYTARKQGKGGGGGGDVDFRRGNRKRQIARAGGGGQEDQEKRVFHGFNYHRSQRLFCIT
jgi:hypothetical protein